MYSDAIGHVFNESEFMSWGLCCSEANKTDETGYAQMLVRIRCRQGSQTQQCILTYISIELHVSAYI